MFKRTRTNGQDTFGGWTRRMLGANGAALGLVAGFSVSAAQAQHAGPPAGSGPTMGAIELFFDSGPTADWRPNESLGASRIITTQVCGIGTSTENGLHIDIPAVVDYTRTVLDKYPGASRYVMVNDVEGHLEKVYSDTAMAFAFGTPVHPDWEHVVAIHVALLNALHAEFPGYLFGYYARPTLPPFVDSRQPARWDRLASDDFARYTAGYFSAYEPVMRASGWLCPQSIYDAYEDGKAGLPEYWQGDHAGAMTASSFNAVQFCRTHFPDKPCIPFCTPYWTNEHYATNFGRIPIDVFMARQVTPCLQAGASGVCVYTGLEWSLKMACTNPKPAYDRYRAWFEMAYFTSSWGPVDWSDPQTRAHLHMLIEEHTLAAVHAIRDALAIVPTSAPAATRVRLVNRDEVVDKAVDQLRSLPTLSGNGSPVENVWEEIKVQVQEGDPGFGNANMPTIRQAIEGALLTAPRVHEQASGLPTNNDFIGDEEPIDELVQDLLGRAGNEEINFAPLGFEYFTFKVDGATVYAKVLARTGWNRIRVRGYSAAAPNGEEVEMSTDDVEKVVFEKEFESAKAALAAPRNRTRPSAPANNVVVQKAPARVR